MTNIIAKTKFLISKLQIKENEQNKNFEFLFKVYNPKTDGIIFLLTALIIPFTSLLIFRFAAGMGYTDPGSQTDSYLTMGHMLVTLVSAIAGLIIFLQRDSKLFIKSGLIIFYLFEIVPVLSALIGSFILSLIYGTDVKDSAVANIIGLWFQIIGEIFIIIWAIQKTTDLKERIISTFKNDWKRLLLITIIGIITIVGICIFLWNVLFTTEKSNNQNQLESLLKSPNLAIRVSYTLTLFVLTVLIAPLAEELTSRHAWYVGTGNRTVGWLTSALFFGMIHVSSGDIQNIGNYLIAGLILSSIFNISRGNVTYSWLVHAGYNLIALILILVQ
ncbi:CAAX amino terminal membrane bound protease [Williamsoniiplasma somnilux]|uniref:CAAX amino terminal membrane bound protease n=1 Tax=Williamsoniiplasma somnilux TaxID=215578 RepID=A0A2K8P285_9MOLU|nr:CPBP family intramembrane glutamic endopeptidase [Williamsoniiplasma somnilux]ATZ19003.1 CAAX amino terminal membrane bound protease [Williamsoniiplasma somnilux]